MSSSSHVPFIQGLATVTSTTFTKPESSVLHAEPTVKLERETKKPTKRSTAPPPLRTQIGVKCSDVVDISFHDYWLKHKAMLSAASGDDDIASVTLLAGSLIRDRIEEKSCVS